ncbi:hypothetical protein CH333_04020 [candidate division WOR-3 bacterium JGI_Cruoil_03_44_89]|uniref:Fibronectin type-III domain-containing protein n=1 Tax=candidate division WOR-3 bacterium JGI_Cruoil_03_44_89 TaxID=1973748 RepID=A0A235BXD0_UNCW3|nr:MAG: hypothetical protein CH333_04020 [candidate division WOR-3 bacterium JGI_Cruoil_03_44_89]
MKARRLFLWSALIGISGVGFAGETQVTLQFTKADLTFSHRNGYDVVTLNGAIPNTKIGEPEIPVKALYISIPKWTKVKDVKVVSTNRILLEGSYNISPVQFPYLIGREKEGEVKPDTNIYNSENPYPLQPAEYTGEGYLAGNKVVSLLVYPLRYHPLTKKLELYTDIKIQISYESSEDLSIPILRESNRRKEIFGSMIEDMVKNPFIFESPHQTVFKTEKFTPKELPSIEGSAVECIIITADEFVDEFETLADWKIRKGCPTVVRTVSWIEANYPGCDRAERIRNFIIDAYSKWGIVWIVLGGDSDLIPPRFCWVNTGGFHGTYIPSDHYYACLEGNWNADGDDRWGEAYRDSVDLYPDVFVGRVPVNVGGEVSNFITKIMNYEKSPSIGYQTKMLLVGGIDNIGKWFCDSVDAHVPDYITKRKLYEVYGNATKQAIIDSMNSGFGLIFSEDHGWFDCVAVQNNEHIYREDIDGLTNLDKSSVWYGVGCLLGAFDHDCIGEHFVLNPDGGGVAFIGSSSYDAPFQGKDFNVAFFDSLFGQDETPAGKMLSLSKLNCIGHSVGNTAQRLLQFGHTLLGDPEMPIWTEVPDSFIVSHPPEVTIGPTNFTVTVKRWKWHDPYKDWIQVPVQDAKVCILKEDEDYAYGFTDINGEITFSFTPESPGVISVTVTKHNFLPHEGSCPVIPASHPYICYFGSRIDDNGVGASNGNNNGKIEAGETIELSVMLKNTGAGTAHGVHTTLSASDTLITVIDSFDLIGDIPQGGTGTGNFLFQVSTNCPDDHTITFNIKTGTQEPMKPWHDEFTLKVFTPSLIHASHELNLIGVNGWYEYKLPTTVRNMGLGDADSVTAVLTCSDPIVVITDSTETFGNILGEKEVTCESSEFTFRIPWDEPFPSGKVFTMRMSDGYNREWVHNFDLQKPAPPSELSTMPYSTSIELSWKSPTAPDLFGYNVYRGSASGGPYTKLNETPICGTAYYEDVGLSPATGYYYVVTTVDSSRNKSGYSPWVFEETNPQLLPGWPKSLANRNVSSPLICNLDRSYPGLEVVVGSDSLYAWHYDGTVVPGFPVYCGGSGSPAAGDIDNDGKLEVVSAPWSPLNRVYAFNGDGTPASGFPQVMDSLGEDAWNCGVIGAPALGDIDKDNKLEIVIGCVNGCVYAFNGDGTGVVNPDGFLAKRPGDSWSTSSPAIGDVNSDDTLDIVVASRNDSLYAWYLSSIKTVGNWVVRNVPGFPVNIDEPIQCDVAMGDIDNYGGLEITFATQRGNLFLLHSNGTIYDNWPKKLWFDMSTHTNIPSFSDIDGDGRLDVVVGDIKGIWAFGDDGFPLPNFPLYREKPINSQPVIGGSHIFVGSSDDRLYGYEKSGERLAGFPIKMGHWVQSSAALADLNCDGNMEIVTTSLDGNVTCFNPGYANSGIEWGMDGHDIWHTGCYETDIIPPLPPQGLSGVWKYIGKDWAEITLNWNPNSESDLSGYYVYRSESSGGPFTYVGTAEPLEKPEFVDIVYAWRKYWYYVTAFDVVGNESGPSDTIRVDPEYYIPCPFLFTWNGTEFVEDNDILTGSDPGEVMTDAYKLTQPLIETDPPRRYKLEIREEETEHSFFDRVILKTVDHPGDVEVGVNTEDEIVSVTTAHTPISAISGGEDYADVLGDEESWFEGCAGDTMVVEFGTIEETDNKELWLNSDKSGFPISIEIEREDGWEYVTSVFPRENFSTVPVISLTELIGDGEALTLRLVWFADHDLKTIKIVQLEDVLIVERTAPLIFAIHSRLGNVRQELLNEDGEYAEVLPGDTIRLEFAVTGQTPGWTRSFVFVSNGYYIIGDKDIAFNNGDITPSVFALKGNYPNPFSRVTTIRYSLPEEVGVRLKIYDIMGRRVMTLVNKNQKPGYYSVSLDGKNLSSGVYFIRLEAGDFKKTQKALLIR